MTTAFGSELKSWRTARRISQLDLGLSANVSARHISFLETGRSRPSRSMVLALCEELQVPRGARNQLLTAAGLAPAYGARDLAEDDMAPVRAAMEWMLERHDPYPAFTLARHWTVQRMNRTASTLMAGLGLGPGQSLVGALAGNGDFRGAIENLDQVIAHAIARLRTEIAHLAGDPVLEEALQRLIDLDVAGPPPDGLLPAFVPTRFRAGGLVLSLFSTLGQFGAAEDVALSEMKIEMMFPADEATRQVLLAMGGAGGAPAPNT